MIWEINGNLVDENGFSESEYDLFRRSLGFVYHDYEVLFDIDALAKYPLFVDNATNGSGYTPITIPVLHQFIMIKLNVQSGRDIGYGEPLNPITIYQFSHELGHYFFYNMLGIDKPLADDEEETLCTAISFCILAKHCPTNVSAFLKNCKKTKYRAGAELAESVNFDATVICQKMKIKGGVANSTSVSSKRP